MGENISLYDLYESKVGFIDDRVVEDSVCSILNTVTELIDNSVPLPFIFVAKIDMKKHNQQSLTRMINILRKEYGLIIDVAQGDMCCVSDIVKVKGDNVK